MPTLAQSACKQDYSQQCHQLSFFYLCVLRLKVLGNAERAPVLADSSFLCADVLVVAASRHQSLLLPEAIHSCRTRSSLPFFPSYEEVPSPDSLGMMLLVDDSRSIESVQLTAVENLSRPGS